MVWKPWVLVDTGTETFYLPQVIATVVVVVAAADKDDCGEEIVAHEVGIAGYDSDVPVHRFYEALLRSPRGGRLPLSVVIAAVAAVVAAQDTDHVYLYAQTVASKGSGYVAARSKRTWHLPQSYPDSDVWDEEVLFRRACNRAWLRRPKTVLSTQLKASQPQCDLWKYREPVSSCQGS